MNNIEYCTQMALELLPKHVVDYPNLKFRHFSFMLDHGGEVLGRQSNGPSDDGKRFGYKLGTLHSEVRAFFAVPLSKQKNIHTCVNVRIGSNLIPRLAAPCRICQGFLKANGVYRVLATPNISIAL